MVLTAANLVHYLLDRAFTGVESVVDGDLRIADLSRRNHAFKVTFRSRPGYVVKQIKKWRASNIDSFETEALWYTLARTSPDFAPLAGFLSKCCGYDAEHQVLLLEFPLGCEDLNQVHRRAGAFPVEMAQLVGATLAAFHRSLSANALEQLRTNFPEATPWVLGLHQRDEGTFESISEANTELLRIAQKYSGFGEAFERLRIEWRRETLINGDMKLAHCILNGQSLYLIDWEMADFGDPYWDAGAIIAEYLAAWVRSMPATPGMSLEDSVKQARRPLTEVQPAIRAFWQSYAARMHSDDETLDRTVRFAAARMIQDAYQSLQRADQMTTRSIRLLQLSLNILSNPVAARQGLLGL